MTRRFHKITFRGFFSERELVDFLHMYWRHFCQILLRTWKRITFLHLSQQIDKFSQQTNRGLRSFCEASCRIIPVTLHSASMFVSVLNTEVPSLYSRGSSYLELLHVYWLTFRLLEMKECFRIRIRTRVDSSGSRSSSNGTEKRSFNFTNFLYLLQ